MVQMTIAVPDNLAERLMSARDRLPEILELGLRQADHDTRLRRGD